MSYFSSKNRGLIIATPKRIAFLVGGDVCDPNRSRENGLALNNCNYDFDTVTATGAAIEPSGAFPRFKNKVDADIMRISLKWHL